MNEINRLVIDPEYSEYAAIVLDGTLKAVGQKNLIFVYENNFPKSNFNKVAHVRNKAGESEYFGENGNSVRLKKPAEVITLKEIPEELKNVPIPTGEYMTKQCFWFNKKYMKQQIKDFIKSY